MKNNRFFFSWLPRFLAVIVAIVCVTVMLSESGKAEESMVDKTDQGTLTRVSVSSSGEQGNSDSGYPSMSADGRFVTFESMASNLVAGDTNRREDVFVHDQQTGQTTRVSVSSSGEQGNNDPSYPSMSGDGRFVTFTSWASNLVEDDTNLTQDVFVHDRQTGQTTRVSVSSSDEQANDYSDHSAISSDGRFIVFHSRASNLVTDDVNNKLDVFVHDRQSGQTDIVSVSSSGEQGNSASDDPSMSADGRFVTFTSVASNLVMGDANNTLDVFVHDRQSGQTDIVSVSSSGEQGNNASDDPSMSADSRFVAFRSWASNLVMGDTNGTYDVFVHDRQTGQTSRISISSSGEQGNRESYYPGISADGRIVMFMSEASNLVINNSNGRRDVFVHDRQTGQTNLVSVSSSGELANYHSESPSISADGRFVAFRSWASNLVIDDTNGVRDVFVYDRNGTLTPTTFSLSGRVTDASGTGIANARITNGLGEYVTSADGTYSISGLPAGTYTITAALPGTNKKLMPSSRTVTVGPNATGVNFTQQVPIILVPGTGASMNMLCFFVSDDLCFNNWATRLTWHWAPHPLIGKQVAGIYYEPLLDALRAHGYTESNGYLEVFHYDWRKPAAANGQLLDQRIKDVLSNTGSSRVDLITHSQGGLVARTYIQGQTYDNTVRNVFFAGVPHQGVTKSYYFWEGGQVVAGDSRMQNEVLQLLINQVYKNNLENQATMFRRVFPSFQGMLPTYNYLRRNNELIPNNTLVWQNTTLPAMNDSSGLLFGRTTVYNFVGTGTQTRQVLTLGDANPSLSTWPDGRVIGENLDNLGDGTVTQKSATLDMVDRQVSVTSTHSDILLNSTTQSVIFGVLGLPVPQVEVHTASATEAQETNFLYVAISGTVDITVTNALGQSVGKNATTIPDAVYVHAAGYPRQMVLIPENTGTYTVTVGAVSTGTSYSLGVLTSHAAQQTSGTLFDAWDTEQAVYAPSQQFVITHDGTIIDQAVPHTSTMSVFLPLIKR